MKILVDIGHPAHVHLFKNFAHEMIRKGHEFLFTVREGEHQADLLKAEGFNYMIIGKKKKGMVRKFIGIFLFSFRIFFIARRFKPDLFLSHGSMYAGYAAFLYRKKHIALEDTGNMEQLAFSKPVSNVILSPESLQVDLGKKHIRYKGFHELAYLHPNRFSPDISILKELNMNEGAPFVILRFISWNASHDLGQTGLTLIGKSNLINEIKKYARVFISSESPLPSEFEEYALKIEPHRLHHALYYATMYIGEGATTASECAMLGTPAIYISSLRPGTIECQKNYGLLFCYQDTAGLIEKALKLLMNQGLKEEFRQKRSKMLEENIDLTSFLIWVVENYPESIEVMKTNPGFQYQFK